MTNTEFKTKLAEAFKAHMFMSVRDCHTVNELLYVLEHDVRFGKEDFNISIKTIDEDGLKKMQRVTELLEDVDEEEWIADYIRRNF